MPLVTIDDSLLVTPQDIHSATKALRSNLGLASARAPSWSTVGSAVEMMLDVLSTDHASGEAAGTLARRLACSPNDAYRSRRFPVGIIRFWFLLLGGRGQCQWYSER